MLEAETDPAPAQPAGYHTADPSSPIPTCTCLHPLSHGAKCRVWCRGPALGQVRVLGPHSTCSWVFQSPGSPHPDKPRFPEASGKQGVAELGGSGFPSSERQVRQVRHQRIESDLRPVTLFSWAKSFSLSVFLSFPSFLSFLASLSFLPPSLPLSLFLSI